MALIIVLMSFSLWLIQLKSWKFKRHPFLGFKFNKTHSLFAVFFLFLLPLVSMLLPPGNDAAMHGYITRLIINNGGIPSNYFPILPIEEFGSYSAGYHTIAAYLSLFDVQFIKEAINLTTVMVYVLYGLGLATLLSLFLRLEIALASSALVLFVSRVPQSSFGWGGNSTVFAFSFIFITVTLMLASHKHRSLALGILAAFPLSALPLTHAIPAVGFVYLSVPLAIVYLFKTKSNRVFILQSLVITGIFALVLLLPFAFNFHDPTDNSLVERIMEWQAIYGPEQTKVWWKNIQQTIVYVQYRISDPLFFTVLGLLIVTPFRGRKTYVFWSVLLLVLILSLVHNVHDWFLPLSHLLYPDRLVYFLTIPIAFLIADFLACNGSEKKLWRYINLGVVVLLCVVGSIHFWKFYLKQNKIGPDFKASLEAIQWLDENVEKDAQIEVSYGDVGIWVPTLINRPTINTHVHFIHLGIFDEMKKSDAPYYYFVTEKDQRNNTPIVRVSAEKNLEYKNAKVLIYQ